jgi:formylglycine-generating enzyme required for sulfatase activity
MKTGSWRKTLCSVAVVGLFFATNIRADDKPPETTTDKITIPQTVVEFKLVKLPAGKITIKDKDGKDKEVAIKSIFIGQTEVTWNEYEIYYLAQDLPEHERDLVKSDKLVIRSRPSKPYEPPERGWGHDGSPAGSMFCREAKNYCKWLSKMTGHKYRLPTEAEWEYACRAGGPPLKPTKAQLNEIAWFADNSDDQTHPVAKKKPNAWGLYDMLGNVAEWVTMLDDTEAVAGGSFKDDAEDVHSAAREAYNNRIWQKKDPQSPQGRSWLSDGGFVGFRIVRDD